MPKNRPSQKKRNEAKYARIRTERAIRENDTAKRVVDDDSLDFAAKIDRLAEVRRWFSADTTIINQYMLGELTTAETVVILAAPIDKAYSSADFGRQYHEQERIARIQRKYHSPEKAIEMWGPEQNFPEPQAEYDPSKSTEMLLWDLWYAILHAAKRITFTDEIQHQKLVSLVKALKARPNPPIPEPMTIPLRRSWIWGSGTVWSDLIVLGISVAEVSNDTCGCGAGWLWPEQRAWENLCSFMARLTAGGVVDLHNSGVQSVVALEQTPSPGSLRIPPPPAIEISSHKVTSAALWTIIAGKEVYREFPDARDERDIQVVDKIMGLRDDQLPWRRSLKKYKGRARWETARKEFARRRFEVESQNEELSLEVRQLAAKAAKAMTSFV
ncbi:hypothetical protein NW762_009311 [Fusarium torreyae]|uniref:Uncharacterized protein n=1 Tax=Fusarium torreyae TaxID=1237075 RepID=A0A9W8RXW2_9HYPO|nr:hypothetical protein NW762_009311 [Fusarium torreyae]